MTALDPDRAGTVRSSPTALAAIALLIGGIVGLVLLDASTGTLRAGSVPWTIGLFVVSFVGFVLAVWANERITVPVRVVWAIAIGLRLLLIITPPTLSDDVYRYLWDGHLVSEGVNPYTFAIEDPAADRYDIPVRAMANNPQMSSPYLPAAHGVFGAAAATLPSHPRSMQFVMVGFDLTAALLLVRLLTLARLPTRRALLYLWNPLVIVEVAHGAHIDALMIALTFGALALTFSDSESRSASTAVTIGAPLLLALATLTRPLPALLLPVLFWRWSWLQRFVYGIAGLALVVPLARGPGFGLDGVPTGTGVFGAARIYSNTFRFNSGVYHWFETWVGGRGLDDRGWNEPEALTRLIIGVILAALLIAVWLRARRIVDTRSLLRLGTVPIAGYVLLSPVMHPWYLLMLLALLVIVAPGDGESGRRWMLLAPWAYLAASVSFSYLTYRDPLAFAELEWVRRLVWMPTLAMLAMLGIWSATTGRRHLAPTHARSDS